jgi:hypothetical protein
MDSRPLLHVPCFTSLASRPLLCDGATMTISCPGLEGGPSRQPQLHPSPGTTDAMTLIHLLVEDVLLGATVKVKKAPNH